MDNTEMRNEQIYIPEPQISQKTKNKSLYKMMRGIR